MIFEAKYKSVKILSMVFILVGATLVANCRADRNPVSLQGRSFYQELMGADSAVHLETVKQDRERVEQSWIEFKLFASRQAAAVKQKLASLDLKSWRERLSGLYATPAIKEQPAKVSGAGSVSATATLVNYAANMNSLQWWQAAKVTADFARRSNKQVAQTSLSLEAKLEASLLQMIELTSSNIIQLANRSRVGEVIQAMSVAEIPSPSSADLSEVDASNANADQSDANLLTISASTDEYPTADPYWQYYTDCDFWGAQFEANVE